MATEISIGNPLTAEEWNRALSTTHGERLVYPFGTLAHLHTLPAPKLLPCMKDVDTMLAQVHQGIDLPHQGTTIITVEEEREDYACGTTLLDRTDTSIGDHLDFCLNAYAPKKRSYWDKVTEVLDRSLLRYLKPHFGGDFWEDLDHRVRERLWTDFTRVITYETAFFALGETETAGVLERLSRMFINGNFPLGRLKDQTAGALVLYDPDQVINKGDFRWQG